MFGDIGPERSIGPIEVCIVGSGVQSQSEFNLWNDK
jgi:hypothetical protein